MHRYGRLYGVADADEHGGTVLSGVAFSTEMLAFHAQATCFDDHAGTVAIPWCHPFAGLGLVVPSLKSQGDKSIPGPVTGFL